MDLLAYERRDPAGPVVEGRREAGQVDVVEAGLVDDRDQLARERAAPDDEDAIGVWGLGSASGRRERALRPHWRGARR
jgi:hypothetical protein